MKKNWTVKQKLLISTSLLIFISVMIVTIVSSENYRKDMVEKSHEDTGITLQLLSYNIGIYLQNFQELCVSPYYDEELLCALSTDKLDSSTMLQNQRIIEAFLSKNILLPHKDIQGAYIFTEKNVYSSKRTQNYLSTLDLDEELLEKVKTSGEPVLTYSKKDKAAFTILSNISDMEDNSKSTGIMRIDANSKGLETVCGKVLSISGNALLIINSDSNLIYGGGKDFSTEQINQIHSVITDSTSITKENTFHLDNNDFILTSIPISLTDWTIYYVSNLALQLKGVGIIQTRSIILGFICAAIGIILSTQLVSLLLKPIYEVTDLMKEVQGEDYTVKAPVRGSDEISYLSTTFNEMTQKINDTMKKNIQLTQQVYEAKYLEKEAQYLSMCNQIKPHFLFNSLNTISILIKCNRNEESISYIEKLASLLNALVHADSLMTLRSELIVCENYLSMQRIRYTNLEYKIEVPKKHLDFEIPALIIQPVVENALIHGFAGKVTQCFLMIKTKVKDNILLIIIEDNGVGIPNENLILLKKKLSNPNTDYEVRKSGVALTNIARRIKLKYGNESEVEVQSRLGEGATFIIKIPLKGGLK